MLEVVKRTRLLDKNSPFIKCAYHQVTTPHDQQVDVPRIELRHSQHASKDCREQRWVLLANIDQYLQEGDASCIPQNSSQLLMHVTLRVDLEVEILLQGHQCGLHGLWWVSTARTPTEYTLATDEGVNLVVNADSDA